MGRLLDAMLESRGMTRADARRMNREQEKKNRQVEAMRKQAGKLLAEANRVEKAAPVKAPKKK